MNYELQNQAKTKTQKKNVRIRGKGSDIFTSETLKYWFWEGKEDPQVIREISKKWYPSNQLSKSMKLLVAQDAIQSQEEKHREIEDLSGKIWSGDRHGRSQRNRKSVKQKVRKVICGRVWERRERRREDRVRETAKRRVPSSTTREKWDRRWRKSVSVATKTHRFACLISCQY